MKSIYIFCSLFLSLSVWGQNVDETFQSPNGIYDFEVNTAQKIFTEGARIRENPNLQANVIDSLQTNSSVTILSKSSNIQKLGKRIAGWHRISYFKNGKTLQGYIWGGNLSISFQRKNGIDFLFGISKTVQKKDESGDPYLQNIASIKAMKGDLFLDEVQFETGSGDSLNFSSFDTENGHRLANIEMVLRAELTGAACGVPTYSHIALFNGKKLIALPTLENISDAGVYYHEEVYVFPDQKKGKPGHILFFMEDVEVDDNDKEIIKKDRKVYLWNGTSVSKQ